MYFTIANTRMIVLTASFLSIVLSGCRQPKQDTEVQATKNVKMGKASDLGTLKVTEKSYGLLFPKFDKGTYIFNDRYVVTTLALSPSAITLPQLLPLVIAADKRSAFCKTLDDKKMNQEEVSQLKAIMSAYYYVAGVSEKDQENCFEQKLGAKEVKSVTFGMSSIISMSPNVLKYVEALVGTAANLITAVPVDKNSPNSQAANLGVLPMAYQPIVSAVVSGVISKDPFVIAAADLLVGKFNIKLTSGLKLSNCDRSAGACAQLVYQVGGE